MDFEAAGIVAAWVGMTDLAVRLFGKADEMRQRLGARSAAAALRRAATPERKPAGWLTRPANRVADAAKGCGAAYSGSLMIEELFPILSTRDLERALAFYRDALGGVVRFSYPGPDGAPVYVGVDLGSSHLGIGFADGLEPSPRPRAVSLWLYADDCDALVERIRSSGGTIVEEPADQPWGERVARVLDPDGNEVIVGQRGAAAAPGDQPNGRA